ncbi:aminopeptidase (leucyl aminopeptidase, aminopeptidase T) 1 [Halorubrum distributum JCM 9100]|uniref:Aminopeptidase (Leucyl aminopeptidase, aminopeptidase T) 1 n=2 Tax=Halorubrum distributum TaxID=29283 RepID=M0EPM1_9EURY|nr:aminopeptidase [Halorubrum distributum]ELZ48369.1 aminopeptidase (leucyl aminopeptidase, aminopeptidase T) 1 [Halorubrum distributum JCM 9100]ELZ55648.1 aminopeptidase (leucyl aminopeptidase, aminopeptidase T) 1 [Halorubrum distributum JCM 10118]
MVADLSDAAATAVEQCLNVAPDESVVVVTDDEREPIGEALYAAASAVTDDATVLRYPPAEQHGTEPPAPVAAAMREADVFLAPTTKSLSHTRARGAACDAGARGATLPGITEAVFTTGLDADYAAIDAACDDVLDQVAGADEVRVTAPAGTDITFGIGDREWLADTGMVREPGDFSNLPAGEVFVAPETATGTFVVDGTMMPHGLLDDGQELAFEVEEGFVTEIGDDEIRADVEGAAEAVGDAAYNLAELGIGTNGGVEELVGSVLLDEKAGGTVHIAIGDNAGIGGETDAPLHLDGIIRNPTVYADGEPVDLPSA